MYQENLLERITVIFYRPPCASRRSIQFSRIRDKGFGSVGRRRWEERWRDRKNRAKEEEEGGIEERGRGGIGKQKL